MSEVPGKKAKFERRAHPRLDTNCQIRYFSPVSKSWHEGKLENYSASGLCFYGDDSLSQDSKITVQIDRDSNPAVPPMAASAVVMRCELEEGARFKIACKLTRIRSQESVKVHYLRR